MKQFFAPAILAIGLISGASAFADELRFAHFAPSVAWQHKDLFEKWAEAVEDASDSRLEVTIFPSQTLGKATAGYDNVVNGIAEMAWTLQGYTAGRFPLTQVIELPGLFESAEVGSCALQKLYDSGALDAEYEETRPVFFHVHAPGHLHTKDTPVTRLEDLQGLKIRRPTAVIGAILSELGAEPIGMPASAIYENLEKGVIDGFMLPWEALPVFRVDELAEHHTEFGFYASAFIVTMNSRAYDRLSDASKAAIDANTGMEWALRAGRGFDAQDAKAYPMLAEKGQIHQIAPAELPAWQAAAERAKEIYLNELEEKGLPGRETYAAVEGYVSECERLIDG